MTVVLDTHVLLWWLVDSPKLGPRTRDLIATAENAAVSTASVWEIAIKRQLGKLDAPDDLIEQLRSQRFAELPISADDAWLAGGLPPHHADPFDRMIAAQTLLRESRLITADSIFSTYRVAVLSATE